jgi:hypothetical protein
LHGINFLDEQTGFLTGLKGIILKYKEDQTEDVMKPVLSSQNIMIRVSHDQSPVIVSLLNKHGEELRELIRGIKNKGDYLFGIGSLVENIPDGVYFVQIAIGQKSEYQKIIVVR